MSQDSKFVRIADMQREAGWSNDFFNWIGKGVGKLTGKGPGISADFIRNQRKLPRVDIQDIGNLGTHLMEDVAGHPQGDDLANVLGRGFKTFQQDTAMEMTGKIPKLVEPTLNTGILSRIAPNLRLNIGCLKVPVEGLAIIDPVTKKVIRTSQMSMGDLLQIAERNPELLRGPKAAYQITDSAKFQNSLDTFVDQAVSKYKGGQSYTAARSFLKRTKLFLTVAALGGAAYVIHQLGPDTPGHSGPQSKELMNAGDNAIKSFGIPTETDNTKIFSPSPDASTPQGSDSFVLPDVKPSTNLGTDPEAGNTYDWADQDTIKRSKSMNQFTRIAVETQVRPADLPQPPQFPTLNELFDFTIREGSNPDGLALATAQVTAMAREAAEYLQQLHAALPQLQMPQEND